MIKSKLLTFVLFFGLSCAPLRASITVMPLGDSITVGYNGVDEEGGYRPYLLNQLTAQGIATQYQGVADDGSAPALTVAGQGNYTAQSGFDTGAIAGNLNGSVSAINSGNWNYGGFWMTGGNFTGRSALNPNIVLLISGANDWDGRSETEAGMAQILAWFNTNRPNTEVIVGSTPPEWGYNEVYTNDSIAVNSWLQTYVSTNYPQDRAVDIVDQFLNSDGSVNTSLLPEYSVHPNQAGYQVIANVFDAAIVASVPEPACISLFAAVIVFLRRRRSPTSSVAAGSIFPQNRFQLKVRPSPSVER